MACCVTWWSHDVLCYMVIPCRVVLHGGSMACCHENDHKMSRRVSTIWRPQGRGKKCEDIIKNRQIN